MDRRIVVFDQEIYNQFRYNQNLVFDQEIYNQFRYNLLVHTKT